MNDRISEQLAATAASIGLELERRGWMLAAAESCTGGWVAQVITSLPGSSRWFERGLVTYSNDAKQELLGVRAETLERYGAVSEQTAREMAEGAVRHSHAAMGLAVTGIAGPGGGTPDKPVGTVCFAWAGKGLPTHSCTCHFSGDRHRVRQQSVITALEGALDFLVERGH